LKRGSDTQILAAMVQSSSPAIKEILTPARIGSLTIKNRLVRSATIECLCPDPHAMDARWIGLYESLSRGGAGLIVTGNFFVNRGGAAQPGIMILDSDAVIPELARAVKAVKNHGAAIFAQLSHGGRFADPSVSGSGPMAPSAFSGRIYKEVARPMSVEEIDETIQAFASAAGRARQAGFDGVEINAAHGYLINQFMAPRTNRRTDRWGGSLDNRLSFLRRTAEEVLKALGPGIPLTIKLNCRDFVRGGVTLEDTIAAARMLESLGVSGLTVSGGVKDRGMATMKGDVPRDLVLGSLKGAARLVGAAYLTLMRRSARFFEGYFLKDAAEVKRNVKIPVIAVGGFRSAGFMEEVIARKQADFIAMARPFIREPDLPVRLAAGGAAACISCNRCTIMTILRHQSLRCWMHGAHAAAAV
jgi:2,4-dienoyl-CoA reductase-like NADH-dependent reductase (Old Yellow Enzyme family)